MIRLLGALLLLTGGLALGLAPAWELSCRAKALRAWGETLLLLEGELAFALPDMPALLATLGAKAPPPAAQALEQVGRGLTRLGEEPFSRIWAGALTDHSGLTGEDLAPLLPLGEALGRYDRDQRDRALETARSRLALREEQCREDLKNKGRAYGAMGLTLGAFLIILLL